MDGWERRSIPSPRAICPPPLAVPGTWTLETFKSVAHCRTETEAAEVLGVVVSTWAGGERGTPGSSASAGGGRGRFAFPPRNCCIRPFVPPIHAPVVQRRTFQKHKKKHGLPLGWPLKVDWEALGCVSAAVAAAPPVLAVPAGVPGAPSSLPPSERAGIEGMAAAGDAVARHTRARRRAAAAAEAQQHGPTSAGLLQQRERRGVERAQQRAAAAATGCAAGGGSAASGGAGAAAARLGSAASAGSGS